MSDYGYRPDPPPEDGRSFGGAEHSGGAYGSASPRNTSWNSASNNPQGNGWGGSDSHPGTGSYGGSASPRQGSYGTPASGSAAVGRASGSASVGGAGGTGRASVGSASVGKATVGSASVGSASVGSARPVSPAGAGAGRATVAGKRRANRAGDEDLSPEELQAKNKRRKKLRRRKVYAICLAAMIVLTGAGTVAVAMFFGEVTLPEEITKGESTTFTYADGETEVAGYGEATRELLDSTDQVTEQITWALLALEDRKYFEHDGVDFSGTVRALVNNATGGAQQGASTITQQYAGLVAEYTGENVTYADKAQEAVMAYKMEQDYSKKEILLHYFNITYYGRGAYGIAAAADVWFDKDIADLTFSEAMVLTMQLKSPSGDFDPRALDEGEEVNQDAVDRWTFGMNALLDLSEEKGEDWITQADIDAGMPETLDSPSNPGSWGHDTATGFITNPIDGYVWEELQSRYGLGMEDFYGAEEGTGGYKIVLTIDKELQAAAVETASRGDLKVKTDDEGNWLNADGEIVEVRADAAVYENEDGFYEFENTNEEAALYDQNLSLASSLVAVDPKTGAVLAYYGGDNGLGVDKAGEENPHPPSSTFKMVTAATAMIEGDASIESWWDGSSPREFDSLEGQDKEEITNHGIIDSNHDVTLTTALRDSLNTPMYAIADKYGATDVLANSIRMGVTQMTFNEEGTPVTYHFRVEDDDSISYSRTGPIENEDGSWVENEQGGIDFEAAMTTTIREIAPTESGEMEWATLDTSSERAPADYQIGFGQYPTTVRDMAAVYATIANDGVHAETHYVAAVYRNGEEIPTKRELKSVEAFSPEIARDLQWVGSKIDGSSETLERDFTGKTGTWEATGEYEGNAHTWYNGAIPQLSVASWVGNARSESAPLLNKDGGTGNTYGATLSEPVWNQFMRAAIEIEGYDAEKWGDKVVVGKMITDDIENEDGTIDPESAFCAKYDDDPRCGGGEDEDEDENEEDQGDQCNGNGNGNNQDCDDGGGGDDGEGPGGDEPSLPGGGEPSTPDDDCGLWGCNESPEPSDEPSTTPETESRD